jgi:WD40 repeat protein/transcriptional regulator with XRE-family HTH domain
VADDPEGDDVGAEGGSGAVGPCDEKPRTEEAASAPPVAREQPGQGEPGQGQPGPGQPEPEHPEPEHSDPQYSDPQYPDPERPDPQYRDPERPDPRRIATQPDFGRELTRARQRAGLTVREVARAVSIPASTAGDYFAGRHLPPPSQPGLLPRILRVCGETDPGRLSEWMSTLNRIRRGPGRRPTAEVPYRGLASFQPEDAPWFFGREDLTARLVGLATAVPAPGVPLTVVGPSGSGKSSLLRAGLIPSMPDWPRRRLALFTPGATPLRELARQLAVLDLARDPDEPDPADPAILADTSRVEAILCSDPGEALLLAPGLTPDGSDPRLLIVVDQFEEIFTACRDEAEQQRFITAICALTGPAVVVAALRADFYDRALRYPELARALQERQVVVVPMTRHEVRSAIVEPASLARLAVEDGLVELLLRDLAPHVPEGGPAGAAHEAGALPLLSHALLTTWSHSHGGRLTVADYQASGGIRHAIARTADQVYGALDEEQRDIARRLFLRLVYVADDAPETRRSVPLAELRDWPGEAATPGEVLGRFVAERLITVDAETAQITHEALLTAWPLLRTWIDANREGLRVRRRLSDAARAWDEAGKDPAALLRGGQLALARDWAADPVNRDSLGTLTGAFVDAGIVAERVQQAAERNRALRLRRLVAALTVLVLVTIGLAGYAFQQRQAATRARDNATAARNTAQSREVAIEADQVRGQSAGVAAQLSLAAYRIAPTADARASLLESSGSPAEAGLIDSAGVVQAVSLSPGHRLLAVAAADGSLRLWNVARPGHPVPAGTPPLAANRREPLYAVAFSPDGSLLAAAGAGRTVMLWNMRAPGRPVRVARLTGPANTVYSLAFSSRGSLLAAGTADDTVRLWSVAAPADPKVVATPLTGPGGYVQSVAFSPDAAVLAAGSADKTVRLWDVSVPAHPRVLGKALTGPAQQVDSVAFSPGGRTLAAGSQDHKVWLWNVTTPARPVREGTLRGATDWVNAVAFSPDGRSLAAGSSDDRVLVWDLDTRALAAELPQPQPVTSLVWGSDGRLVAGDADGRVRTWVLPTPVLRAGGAVNSVAYSHDGRLLAVGGPDLQLWDPVTRGELAARAAPGPAGTIVNAVTFLAGGATLAAGYSDGDLQLWEVAHGRSLIPLSQPVRASTKGLVEFTAFSPHDRLLATCGDDGTVRLWSVTDPVHPRLVATVHDSRTYVFSAAFSPDGRTLAAASADDLTRLWNVSQPGHPEQIGAPLQGPASYAISVAFSPDGRTLAVGSADKRVRLWDVADLARPVPLGHPLTGPTGYVYSVSFSPDGRTLAAGVTDGTVWLWRVTDPARPNLVASLTGPAHAVYSVAFAPGGASLAAGSADGTVRLWDTQVRAASGGVCATAGQQLTRAEWRIFLPGRRYAPPCEG